VETDIGKSITVSDAEVHDFYKDAGNKDKFEMPEQIRARHILVKVDEKADAKTKDAAQTKAKELLKAVQGGAEFAEVAKKVRIAPRRRREATWVSSRAARWSNPSTRRPSR